jgi:glycosyltransferase involved in cell wall biosynthesis
VKILHVETGMHLYGGALQVHYLLAGLHARGIDNLLLCPAGSAIAEAARSTATVHAVPMRGEADVTFAWRMWRLIVKERPDILHIHSRRGADLWGSLVTRWTGQPAVLTRRVDNPEPGWLARWKCRPFRKLVTISEGILKVLLAEGVPADKVMCIHSSVEVAAWQQPPDRAWFNREFRLPADARPVAVIAQLIERKGHRHLIAAIPAILAQLPQAYFLFFGKGPIGAELAALCHAQGIDEHVVFAGFREDMPRIMPNLDLVVHPALMEGLGVSLIQAAAAGVPIVASRAGGIPEIVRAGVNGVLVEPGDVAGLAREICGLLGDPKRHARLAAGGKTLAGSEFSVEAMVSGNLAVYRMIGGRRPGNAGSPAVVVREGSDS